MHGENATSQDAEQLVGDPPAQMVVAPELVRPGLVPSYDDPLECDGKHWQSYGRDVSSDENGGEERWSDDFSQS